MNDQPPQQRIYSDEEIRAALNESGPTQALEITLSLLQRMTLALESMAQSMLEPPTVLFEQADAPLSDGLGNFGTKRDDDKSH